MIPELNRKSLALGIPGIALQVLPYPAVAILHGVGLGNVDQPGGALGLVIGFVPIIGTILLLAGLAYYAKAKGRRPAWCLLAFLSCIGLIMLASLEDRAPCVVLPRPPFSFGDNSATLATLFSLPEAMAFDSQSDVKRPSGPAPHLPSTAFSFGS